MPEAAKWRWSGQRVDRWERVRTLAHQAGEPVIKLLEIPGAFVPGAPVALQKLRALLGADLNISALDSEEVLQPLDGAPGPFCSSDGSEPVFIEGLRMSVTVAHNGKGPELVLLERLDLHEIEFTPGSQPAFDAAIAGSAVHGAGLVDPMRFFVELEGPKVHRARRMLRGADGKSTPLRAESANFLDTDPGSFVSLGPNEPPAMFRITATALSQGLYRFCLRWFYRVGARELRQHTSLPVSIYSAGS
jgi:hypothetical protein